MFKNKKYIKHYSNLFCCAAFTYHLYDAIQFTFHTIHTKIGYLRNLSRNSLLIFQRFRFVYETLSCGNSFTFSC